MIPDNKDNQNAKPWDDFKRLSEVLRQCDELLGRPVVFLDFEFNNSAEPRLNLVCVSLMTSRPYLLETLEDAGEMREIWLHQNPENVADLQRLFKKFEKVAPVLVAYAVPAEARSLLSAFIEPGVFDWVDLFADWRQLTFNNLSCEYGTYFTETGYKRRSVPPSYDKNRNKGKDNNKIGLGLVDCVGLLFDTFLDSNHKKEMRDLIIRNDAPEIEANKKAIMDYCSSDVYPLPFILIEQQRRLAHALRKGGITKHEIIQARLKRGKFMVSVAKMEARGFPLDLEAVYNLRRNFESARASLIEQLVEVYPFYTRKKAPGKYSVGILGDWVESSAMFKEYLETRHPELLATWPRTDTGQLSTKDEVLNKYSHLPEIRAFASCRRNIKQLAWFKEPDEAKKKKDGDFFDNVGSDGRLRTFLGAYGTQTSRNAPKASRFILAMSSWLRCLIRPPKGRAIIAVDYASQEFAIAAVLSNDIKMVEAYKSGDPYLYFAKQARAVPMDADPKTCKSPEKLLFDSAKEWDKEITAAEFFGHPPAAKLIEWIKEHKPAIYANYREYKKHEEQRALFKSTTLGLQYGMGAEKLAVKLTNDMGTTVTVKRAEELIALHKKVFKVYWAWLEKISARYERAGCLILRDGWALLGDNDNFLSVRNFPTQGTGAAIMREAVHLGDSLPEPIDFLSPLHDALYSEADEDKIDQAVKAQTKAMSDAVAAVIGDTIELRLDVDVHKSADRWIDPKGMKYYKLLGKYLERQETEQDRINAIMETIYK